MSTHAAVAAAESPRAGLSTLRIEPSRGWVGLKLGELWAYRELLFFLTWRDVKVRYKQTALGAAWAVLQPVLTMLVFTLFFGKLAGLNSDGKPYAIWSLAALVPWTFFSMGLTNSTNSLVTSANLVKKIYFPRLCIPLSTILSGVVDFCIAFVVLLAMMPFFHVTPTLNVVFLPLFFLLALVTSLGVGLWLTALNVQYRDVRYVVPFLTQFWMFGSPIVYSSQMIAERYGPVWHTLYGLNPMVGVVEGFRWCLLDTATRPGPMVAVSAGAALVLLVTGALYFRKMEKHFADIV
jgi:lipopolysaccharide transport system permease protein